MEILKTFYYKDTEEFITDVLDKYNNLNEDCREIGIVAKYDEAKEIVKALIQSEYDIVSIDIHDESFEGYCDEYVISLTTEGIYCEKFKRENGYFTEYSDITYISNECNSACIKHVESDKVFAFGIGEEEIDDTDVYKYQSLSDYSTVIKDSFGNPKGFTKSWTTIEEDITSTSTYSFYSNNIEELNEVAEKFGVTL